MRKLIFLAIFILSFAASLFLTTKVLAAVTPIPTPAADLTEKTQETLGPLEELLQSQELGAVWPFNPIKYAIRGTVAAGVPTNTIVLLLLIPVVAAIIAAARHMVGPGFCTIGTSGSV